MFNQPDGASRTATTRLVVVLRANLANCARATPRTLTLATVQLAPPEVDADACSKAADVVPHPLGHEQHIPRA